MDFASVGTSEGADWDDWTLQNLTSDEGVLTLGSHGTNVGSAELPALAAADLTVRAFDTDDCGVCYLLTGTGDLYRYHHAEDRLTHLRCVADADPEERYEPVDLAVTRDDVVIAETLASAGTGDGGSDPATAGDAAPPGRLHALSKHLLQTRWVATGGVGTPIRLLADDRRVFLLTERVVPGTAPPERDGVLARVVRGGVGATIRTGLRAPRDAALAGERIVVLTDDGSVAVTTEGDDVPDWHPPAVRREGQVVPPRCLTSDGESLVVGLPGGETLVRFTPAFTDSGAGDAGATDAAPPPARTAETVPGVRHPTARLLARRHDPAGVYVLDDTGTLRFSAAVRRFTADTETGRYAGTARRWFDSGERGVAWHRTRLSLSAAEPGTGVTVRYCATDDPPAPVVPTGSPAAAPGDADWRTARDPADALLDDAEGRYLGLELELVGTDATSPRVSSVRAFLPRQSYLRYLPAIYDTDAGERSFLERYLSIFESAFVDVAAGIESLPQVLDPGGVPAEFVGWLGSWLASETDSAWPTAARREFLARAPELYRLRGTPAGLVETVRIYLRHAETEVPDWFRERPGAAMTTGGADPSPPGATTGVSSGSTGGGSSTGDPSSTGPTAGGGSDGATGTTDPGGSGGTPESTAAVDESDPTADGDLPVFLWEFASFDCIDDPEVLRDWRRLVDCPQCFLLLVPPGVGSEAMAAIDRIVAWATPAHAVGQAVELRPWLRLGANGYLGVNSYLGDRAFVVEDALLGADSVLDGRDPDGQLGLAGRLGREARLS
jgi:phage tail-like protein